jgi:hypothetical protein
MKHSEYEKLAGFSRTLLNILPFVGGGLAQAWEEGDSYKTNRALERVLIKLHRYVRNPDAPTVAELTRVIEEFVGDTSGADPIKVTNHRWQRLLRSILLMEIPKQLRSLDPASSAKMEFSITRLIENPSFMSRVPHGAVNTFLHQASDLVADTSVAPSDTLNHRTSTDLSPEALDGFSVSSPAFMVGTAAILFHMKYIKKIPIQLDFRYAHTIELARLIELGTIRPDACVFGDAAALAIIEKVIRPKYELALLLPRVEQRIVRVKASLWSIDRIRRFMKADPLEGDLYFLRDPVSTPLFHVEHLVRTGRLDLKRISDRSRQPHESVEILENGGPSTHVVLWSPHWQIYEWLGIGESIPKLNYDFGSHLFMKARISKRQPRRARAFKSAFRASWIDLLDASTLRIVVDEMMRNTEYVDLLHDYCGLHSFRGWVT